MKAEILNVGFMSTRIAGTDGVSLEIEKWAAALKKLGHECFYFAGECDRPEDVSFLVPEAHFKHPEIITLTKDLFDDYIRSQKTSRSIQKLSNHLKNEIYKFQKRFDIELLIVENSSAIPMNVPLGLAIAEFIAETEIPTIGHHHDFSWERARFSVNSAADYLDAAFPPSLNSISHVVINSYASSQLASRKGLTSTLIPNVMDFDNPPPEPDGYASDFRADLGIRPDECIILQPTRIVPRKRIELAIELARRLDRDCVLLITHESGDEGTDYEKYLQDYADILGVHVMFGTRKVNHNRSTAADGSKIYALADAYRHANIVSYPSTIEGFGNAFLETIYYKQPIVISTYEIFKTDIQPKGFRVVGFDDFISSETVRLAHHVLDSQEFREQMVEYNYETGRRHYSYATLEANLAVLIKRCAGT
jgi:glycosyltransferase involved in cell wall biosynthesis